MKVEFNLSVNEIIYNYLIMMGVILVAGFSGYWVYRFTGAAAFPARTDWLVPDQNDPEKFQGCSPGPCVMEWYSLEIY